MSELVTRLKHAARRLHRAIERGDPVPSTVRVRLEPGEALQRRHCLHAVASRVGFDSWSHARAVLERTGGPDLGLLMYRDSGGGITNIWSASYAQAQRLRAQTGGFLLPYRRQFQVVEAPYIAWLGLDPAQADWEAIGRDWVQPAQIDAWTRITHRRLDVLLPDSGQR